MKRQRRHLWCTAILLFGLVALADRPSHAVPGGSTWLPRFADDTDVSVYIEQLSFTQCGWGSSTHIAAIEKALEKSIHLWQTTTGMRVNFRYEGLISRSPTPSCDTQIPGNCNNVNLNELILVCNNNTQGDNPLGHAYGRISGDYEDYPNVKPLEDKAVIVFYKGSGGSEWDWVFGSPASVEDEDFYTVLLHEIGHIYGVMHTCELIPIPFWPLCATLSAEERTIAERTVMYPSLSVAYPWNRTGPQTKDIDRMRDAWNSYYNPRTDVGIKLGYSYSSNDSWSQLSIDTGGSITFQSPTAAYGPALYDDIWIAYFMNFIYWVELRSGNGVSMSNLTSFYDITTNHSPGIGIIGNDILVASIDQTFDHTAGAGRQIEIKHTPNGGTNWYTRTSIPANSPTRVDVAVTELTGGQTVWIVAWTDAETFEARAALSINDGVTWYQRYFRNEVTQTNLKAVGALDVTCTLDNTCQLAYREWSTSTSQWLGFRSLHFTVGIFIIYPLLFSDSGGPVVISNYYNGGMPARVFMESLASIGPSIDYHVNTGYGGYNRTTRAWRKLQSQSPAPNTFSFVGPVLQTTYDVINSIEVDYLGYYPYLFGYFVERN